MAKFNLEFSDNASKTLEQIAKTHKASKTDIVRQALNVYAFLEEAFRNGGKIYVESPNGEKTQVVIP
jgi:predicted transcriptional regulator